MEKGNWRNLLRGGKRELEKSFREWKKGTGEICYGVEKRNCKNLLGEEKRNWENLLGGEKR